MKPQTHQHTDRADNVNHTSKANRTNKVGILSKVEAIQLSTQADISGTTKVTGKWAHLVKAAQSEWSQLSEAEILKSEGNLQQLAGLVQHRYAIARHLAEKWVKVFLEQCNFTR